MLGVAEAELLLDAGPVVDGLVALAVDPLLGDDIGEKLEASLLVDELADPLGGVFTVEDVGEDAEVFEDSMPAADALELEGPLEEGNGVWPGDTVPEASDLLGEVVRLTDKLVPLKPAEVMEDFDGSTAVEELLTMPDGAGESELLVAGGVVIDGETVSEALWNAEVVLDPVD